MKPGHTIVGLVLLSVLPYLTTIHAQDPTSARASLMTVEGIVRAVETLPAATGADVTAVRITVDKPEPREITVLLAPANVLRQTGFEVELGDRMRARLFLTESAAFEAHKVLNLSRGMMVRLRTLRRVPLWDSNGEWQGGPCRNRDGSGGNGHRGHRGSGGGSRSR